MPWNVKRTAGTIMKEILKFPAGLDAIESVVLAASEAPELSSGVTNGVSGVLGYQAGTLLQPISGDSQGRLEAYNGGTDCVGVLIDNIYFYDDSDASDEPASVFFHNCVFNKDKLIGYSGNETQVKASLYTCRFEEGS